MDELFNPLPIYQPTNHPANWHTSHQLQYQLNPEAHLCPDDNLGKELQAI